MREPPDPTSFKPRDIQELLYLGRRFHGLGEERMYDTLRFWTMSAADFLDEYFESEIVKAHFAGSSIIGTALGPALAGHGVCAAAPLHGRHRRYRRRMGLRARRHGRDQQRARKFPSRRAGAPSAAPRRWRRFWSRAAVRAAWCSMTARKSTRRWSFRISMCGAPSSRLMDAKDLPGDFLQQVKNFKIRGSSGKLNIALDGLPRFPAIPQGRLARAATCTSPTPSR